VQPLVDDLNGLLAQHEAAVARANAKAADLAHGLKTPLAVLSNEAERLAARGDGELASILAQQVVLMQRQINYQLAQARAAQGPSRTARSVVTDSVAGLIRALTRLHASRGLALESAVGPDVVVRCAREDLDEQLGNLLDNACKWAASRVVVSASAADGVVTIDVDDDGPGLPASRREAVLQRGVRADEAVPGSGLGLAIVRDIAELHGGSIVLDGSPAGGLRARLRLPAA
jgi:signal transduction histidine kinase